MLLKIVLGNQIRLFDCKDTLKLEALHAFIDKTFSNLKNYSLYYFDEENDQIILQTKQDVAVYLESFEKKPKIHIRKVETEVQIFQKSVVNQILQSNSNQKKQQQEKVQQIQIESKSVTEIKKEQIPASQQKEQNKQDLQWMKQKNNYILHDVQCTNCQHRPIKNIRYKCARCEDLNYCQLCFEETTHKDLHPFVKIRDPNSAPVSVRVNLGQPEVKKEQKEKKEMKQQKDQQIKYQSELERQQLIVSYLQDLFGSQNFQSYREFAKQSNQRSFKKIYESYLSWLNAKNEPSSIQKLWGWLGTNISKHYNKFMNPHIE